MSALKSWKARARLIKDDVVALSFAVRDPRVPWYAKVAAACVVAYALSPIDLIPDFIPVLGYLDDLVLVPLGVWVVVRLIPADVLAECRARPAGVASRALVGGGGRHRRYLAPARRPDAMVDARVGRRLARQQRELA